MWVYLCDVIDENRFHNCVHAPVSTKGIAADHENWIEQRSMKRRLIFNLIHDFGHSCCNYPANGEERGDTDVFVGKDTMKQ